VASRNRSAEIGRFAPSPTGPLHLGSLLTAVASWLDARAHGGQWLVRIEDLDEPRCVPGAADAILRTLERHALEWDALSYQHQRIELYRDAIARLDADGRLFACTCSRSQLQDSTIYPGTCHHRRATPDEPCALRVRVPNEAIEFVDGIQGTYVQHLDRDVGDFVVYRRDGIAAYQLAVVVDDAAQHISRVVRGADLLDNTPRQIYLFHLLKLRPPQYLHVPVLADRSGHKLSKHAHAMAIDEFAPGVNLQLILALLGHDPPHLLQHAPPRDLLAWAVSQWNPSHVPRGVVHPGFVCI
jgi:glutamyl-Q tRNA(Asp) synthetase